MKFECVKCGKCCKVNSSELSIFATPAEIEIIEQKTGLHFDTQPVNDKTVNVTFDTNICKFLKEDNTCAIEDCKPLGCKVPQISYTWFEPCWKDECPGLGVGKEYTEEEIYQFRKQLFDTYGVIDGVIDDPDKK